MGESNQRGGSVRAAILGMAVLAGMGAVPLAAQTMDHSAMTHGAAGPAAPLEPGQGAFAAVAEIAAILAQDPATDWSRVDITGLRDHLVDMDGMVTRTVVHTRDTDGGIEMTLEPGEPGNEAALRMVPAHAPVLTNETGWYSVVEDRDGKLVWTVTSAGDAARIRALGFFGLMATGAHHQAHHMALARGEPMH